MRARRLYPVLLHFWLAVSHAQVWVRLLSAVFGVLAVAMVALVSSRAFGWRAGLGAAFIMAVAPAHVHYAQYVRSYSLFTLLAAAHVWLYLEWLDQETPPSFWRAALAVALTTALLYTHYLALLLFVGEALIGLWWLRHRFRRVLAWGALGAAAGVLFLPGLPLLMHNVAFDRLRNVDRPNPPPLHRLAPNVVSELVVGQHRLGFGDPVTRRATLGAAAVLFPLLWLIGAARGIRTRPTMVIMLCAVSVVPIAIYLLSGRKLVTVRFFLPFSVGLVALMGYGLSTLGGRRRWIAAGAVALLGAIPLWHFYGAFSWS